MAVTYFGSQMHCDARDLVQCAIMHFRIWEPNISKEFERRIKAGDIVVDVGANVGYYSLLAAKLVGEQGHVVALEASPGITQMLVRNIALNHVHNVRVLNVAVAGSPGKLTVYRGPSHNSGSTTTREPKDYLARGYLVEGEVVSAPLDQILSSAERARVSLIKIDVEGGEVPILQRFVDTIEQYGREVSLIVEARPRADPPGWQTVFDRLTSLGYEAYEIKNFYNWNFYLDWRRAYPLTKLQEIPSRGADLLFVRSGSRAVAPG